VLAAAVLLAGCNGGAGDGAAPAEGPVAFDCKVGDGFRAVYAGDRASVTVAGRTVELERQTAARGAKYVGEGPAGPVTLWTRGLKGRLELPEMTYEGCVGRALE
jgi:membrane-bound inhibitor of C-type lysozyme